MKNYLFLSTPKSRKSERQTKEDVCNIIYQRNPIFIKLLTVILLKTDKTHNEVLKL